MLIFLGSLPNATSLNYYLYCFLVGDVRLPNFFFIFISSFERCYFHKTGTHLYLFFHFFFLLYRLLKLHAALVCNSIAWIGPNVKELNVTGILDIFLLSFVCFFVLIDLFFVESRATFTKIIPLAEESYDILIWSAPSLHDM